MTYKRRYWKYPDNEICIQILICWAGLRLNFVGVNVLGDPFETQRILVGEGLAPPVKKYIPQTKRQRTNP